MKKIYRFSLCILLLLSFSFSLTAQNSFFAPMDESAVSLTNSNRVIIPTKYNTVKADMAQLKTFLWSLPSEKTVNTATAPIMQVPMPNGQVARFRVWETHIQSPELAAKFPTIKTFAGQGIDDPHATIWFDYGPRGFHGQVLSVNGSYYIDPYAVGNTTDYISYFRKDLLNNKGSWACDVPNYTPKAGSNSITAAACRGTEMRTYRLAVACTGEYAQAPGINAGTNPAILHAAIVTSVNRVVGVYRTEVSISMTLVATNNLVEFLDAATDPFTGNNNANVLINESQTVIDANILPANYDIGHTFSTGGGGLAQLNSPCGSSKARGITGSPNPTGDAYDIDYVAHEMGHQFGGNHTMAGCGSSPANTKLETGSGTTIQAYAGICGGENIQPNSDPFFHAMSFDEISNFVAGAGAGCGTTNATGNGIPVIGALTNNGANIPISTPFTLTGTATDPNNDPLTYCWEQWDAGGAVSWNAGATAAAGNTVPLFKSRIPKTTGSRTFPDIAVILAGYPAAPPAAMGGLKGETLSPVARAMKFKLSVRDNRTVGGGYASSGTDGCQTNTVYQVNVINTGAPFAVTVPNGGESYTGGSTQTVTWNVVGSSGAPINCTDVRITMSTDGGLTYSTTVLASTPNDGTQSVTIPNVTTTTARMRVEAVGNVFFDISNANFSITGGTATNPTVTINQAAAQPDPTSASPINFTVVFDQAVTGFATGDVTLTGTAGATTGTVTGSGTTYNVAVSGMATSGTVIATIPAGVCINVLNETNLASTSTDNTVTYNAPAAPPTVTINQAAAQPDPTGVTPINFTVVFDQVVTGFATGDVTLTGTAGATTGTVTGSGTTYNVAVTGMTGSGTVIATVPAGVAQNGSAQPNSASTSTDNTVTFNFPAGCTSVNPVPNQTVCNGAPTTAVNFTSPTPGTTFSWVNNTPSIGLAASGNGNIASFTATNATALPVTATITVTPTLTTVTATTTTFNFTGGAQTFTVPAGVSSINITTLGAQGGTGATGGNGASGGVGGLGSRATGTLAVTPGQVLTIFVGGQGGSPTSGYNGGGTGGNANSGGGGGASDVRFPGATSADRILVAGGGGGGGRAGCEPNTVNGGAGGNGDGNGANGVTSPNGGGGFGAIGTTPGGAGIGCAGFLGSPGLGGFGPSGGNGGAGQSCCCFTFASVPGGGGGGGGFLGGAGGGGGSAGTTGCLGNDKGGGGGGAGGTSNTGGVTAGAITTAIQSGNGQVILNYNVTVVCTGPTTAFTITVNPTATVSPAPANQSLCAGSPTAPVNFTSATPGVIFNWTNTTPAIGLAASGTGNIASFTALNPGLTPLVATITVTPLVPVGGTIPGGPVTFTNAANIAIPATGTGSGTGSASNPYPSNITVSGVPTTGVSVQSVTLTNIQHTWSDDIGVLLVGPGGQKFVPMARVGGSGGFDAAATVTLRDGNPAMPTATAAIPSGTYAPTAGTAGAIWPAPAPVAPYSYPAPNGTATFANTFNTTSNYNGTWSLYVTDMAGGDIGNIAGGWSITVVTPTAPAVGCFGTPSSFTITVNPNPAIVILADPGTTICEGDPTLLTVVTGSATTLGVLYNQTGAQINGSPSQVFEPANTAFNSQSADDFTVPAGATWGITQFTFNGIGAGTPTSVNLFVYNNSGSNLPGAAVATYNNLTTYTQAGANYTVNLPSALNLSAGTYWVSFQVNMSFAAGGQWFWANFGNTNIGNQYAWQNPGGGFGTPCAAWGYGATGCNVGGGVARNNIFSVTGTSIIGGAPLPAGYTFLWSPALGLSSTTSNPVAASPMNTTTYTVVATGPGPAFCSRTASVLITVNKRPVVTAQPANTVRCVGNTATFTVGATGTGLTYQWQESLTGCPGTIWGNLNNGGNISGATSATLQIANVTQLMSGRGYRCIVNGTCTPFIPPTNVSNCATLTVNPNPVVAITPAGPVCGGVAGISGTALSTATTPPPVPGSVSVNSGTINLAVPDNTANGVSNVIAMAGVPANATITNVSVTLNNFSHTYPGDMIIHLQAPNGQILNLYKYGTGLFTGPASGVPTWGWYGAKVSQTGTTAWSTVATAPFIYNNSTAWGADAINTPVAGATIQNPTGFVSAAPNFAALYTTPASTTGNWTLAMCDGGPGDVGTLTSWNLTIDYTTPGTTSSTLSYVWAPVGGLYTLPNGTGAYTGQNLSTVYAAPTALTTYTVTATDVITGCFSTASVLVNYTPPAPTVTPSSVTMCLGDPAVRLVSSSATTTSVQFCSGPISVIIPDANAAGATSNITVSGIPAACNVSAMSVNFNMSHTWAGDVAIALRAPNGNVLNLDYYLSNTGGTGATTGFTNTTISSTGTAALSSVGSPYTGTFRADAVIAAAPPSGPTGFLANVTTWNALYSVPNGVWTLAMVDAFAGDQGTLTSWCINMSYVCGVPSTAATWSPIGGLFNDAAASIAYTGDARDTVWTRPTPAGVYTYQVTVQSVPAFLPVPPAFTNPASITINGAGAGTPYPANLVVAGLPVTGVSVQSVTLTGFNHTWSDDVDILLQSPSGTNVILMSDVGGANVITTRNYTFQDGAPAMGTGANAAGTYRPTNLVGTLGVEPDNWPAPGPGAVAQAAPALSLFGSTADMNGTWKLFVVDDAAGDAGSISGGYTIRFNVPVAPCTSPARTVVVTVNQPTVINANIPVNQTICTDKVATFSAAVVSGTGPHSYQWQVSIGGAAFTNVANGGVYSGATTAMLTITAPPVSFSTNQYRCIVTGAAPCAAQTSRVATLVVNPLPVIVISATAPRSLLPGLTSTFTSTVSPNPAVTYSWIRNGVVLNNPALGVVSGLNTGSIVVDVDGMGDYQLRVTDVNGCTNISNTVTIKDSASAKCFIYPNPTSGKFQVRYYSVANNVLPRTLTIFDAKGDRVLTQFYTIGRPYDRMDVDMRAFGKGLYWVEIGDRNGNRLTMCRVVIQ